MTQTPSLSGQISAVRRLAAHLERNPGALRASEVSYEAGLLNAAADTLEWLQRNAGALRAAKEAERQDSIARAGLDL